MTDPAKTGPLLRKLDDLAPYPPADATAPQVARWLAARGLLSAARSQGGRDAFPPSPDHVHLLGAQFAAAFFLQGMTELAEAMTDPVAGRTIEAAADIMAVTAVAVWNGGDFAAPLRNLIGEDAEAVAAAAEDLAEAMAAPEPEPDDASELESMRLKVAEYENAINWNTSCLSCATVLDSSIREHERAERAEMALSQAVAALRRLSLPDCMARIGQDEVRERARHARSR